MDSVIPAVEYGVRGSATLPGHVRHAGRDALEVASRSGREQLFALFEGFERALGRDGLRIAFDPVLNLPLWELGHIGWFEEYWLSRNPDRHRGSACDPAVRRTASVLPDADKFYDSSNVPHAQRWVLDLPGVEATRGYLAEVRESTLGLLRDSSESDDDLYFFRLVLLHEDMHREAWHFMAQHLGVNLGPAMTGRAPKPCAAQGEWQVAGGVHALGFDGGGFAFDNELCAHPVPLDDFSIDRVPVSWGRFLPFVRSGGYETENLWTAAGWAWRGRQDRSHPAHVRPTERGWQQRRFGEWVALDPHTPALHLSAHEAEAWCRWAGRRLPTEAEWEVAALRAVDQNEPFEWGDVWEWTASPFVPFAGFVPHPYRDYSQPWFDGRPVLRGGSFATSSHMKHPRYRNFFTADRSDVFAGFRSCALNQGHLRRADGGPSSAL
ncbi:MAG: selenoneine synthase SenA [Burkholderiaceae bacterium]